MHINEWELDLVTANEPKTIRKDMSDIRKNKQPLVEIKESFLKKHLQRRTRLDYGMSQRMAQQTIFIDICLHNLHMLIINRCGDWEHSWQAIYICESENAV